MKQRMGEFLVDIAQIFPIPRGRNAERVIEETRTYLIGYCYNKNIDFERTKKTIFDNYTGQYFPTPNLLLGYLLQNEIKSYDSCVNDGSLLLITLPNGQQYEFVVSSFDKPLSKIKEDIERKHGNCTIEAYPKGTVIIGGKIFTP